MIAEAKIDLKSYGQLLAKTTPKIIENEQEYEGFLSLAEELLEKADNKTLEEQNLLKLMVILIEEYEDRNYQLKEVSSHQILQHLMDARDLKPKDLVHLFNSRGYTSDIINGRRPITVTIAKKLGEFFGVEPGLFVI